MLKLLGSTQGLSQMLLSGFVFCCFDIPQAVNSQLSAPQRVAVNIKPMSWRVNKHSNLNN